MIHENNFDKQKVIILQTTKFDVYKTVGWAKVTAWNHKVIFHS